MGLDLDVKTAKVSVSFCFFNPQLSMALNPGKSSDRSAGRDSSSSSSKTQGNANNKSSEPIAFRRRVNGIPTLPDLQELSLHSPSSQMVSTPFDSTLKFEYPFPDSDPASSTGSSSSSPLVSPSVNLSPPYASGSTFPFFSASTPSVPPGPVYPDTSSTSTVIPVHPKFKLLPNAAVPPPSLMKKHPKWSSGNGRRTDESSGS